MTSLPTKLLLAFVAALAMSTTAVASASASEFVFSKTGTLKGEQVGAQHFVTGGGTAFECKKDKVSGSTAVLKSATQKVTVQYEKCSFVGVGLTATAAEYELNTNGTYKLLKAFTMSAPELCTMTFPVQNLSGDTYKNASGKLEVSTAGTIRSSAKGSVCEWPEGNMSVEGKSLIELVGGTIEVK